MTTYPLAASSAPAGAATPSPLRAVLDAFHAGCTTLGEVAVRAGLDRDLVEAAVAHLVRTGHLVAETMSTGCPSGGCGSCASGGAAGPGCGASGPSVQRSGPVLVTLSLPRAGGPGPGG